MKSLQHAGFWLVQISAIAGLFIWAIFDPALELMVYRLRLGIETPLAALSDAALHVGASRVAVACGLVALVLATWMWRMSITFQQFSSTPKVISLRLLFGLTTLFAVWCAFAINYSSVSMRAKGIRISWKLTELESLAGPLREQWPSVDGDSATLGPFMAYPFGRPTTLLLLTPPTISQGGFSVSTIERGVSGELRFLLGSETSGTDYGDWIEWHPEGNVPQDFVGGLNDLHELRSQIELGSGWFLVRYEA